MILFSERQDDQHVFMSTCLLEMEQCPRVAKLYLSWSKIWSLVTIVLLGLSRRKWRRSKCRNGKRSCKASTHILWVKTFGCCCCARKKKQVTATKIWKAKKDNNLKRIALEQKDDIRNRLEKTDKTLKSLRKKLEIPKKGDLPRAEKRGKRLLPFEAAASLLRFDEIGKKEDACSRFNVEKAKNLKEYGSTLANKHSFLQDS